MRVAGSERELVSAVAADYASQCHPGRRSPKPAMAPASGQRKPTGAAELASALPGEVGLQIEN
jgi:hypothetical protein